MSRPRSAVVALALFEMTRPLQIVLVVVVALLGVAAARARGGNVDPATVAAGLILLVPIAASIHLANEYADHETDARTHRTPFSGGSGALPRTGLPRTIALVGARVAAVGGAMGAVIAWRIGLLPGPALGLLVAGLVGGWAYSVGRRPLAWIGLGEIANAVLGGLLLPLYGFALAEGAIDPGAVAAFAPLALLVGANLLATTWPDRTADAYVGKRTLATRWTTGRLRASFAGLAGGAMIALVALAGGPLPGTVALAGLSAAPLLVIGLVAYTRYETPLPTVAAMVWLVVVQLAAWATLG